MSVPEILEYLRLELRTGHLVFVDLGLEAGAEVKVALRRVMRGCENSALFYILGEANPKAAKKTWFVAPMVAVHGVMSWDCKVKSQVILAKIFRFRLEEGDL